MRTSRKLLYFVSFLGLAVVSALAVARMGTPSVAPLLVWAVVMASLAGAPGLVRRRAWPVALLLLPLGAYLGVQSQMPAPPSVEGFGDHAGFYLDQLRSGAQTYATRAFPVDFDTAPDLKLLLSLLVYGVTGLAAFAALSLRRALPAIAIALVPLGFGLTVDGAEKVLWLPLAFLLSAGCLLMLSRSLQRERWRRGDAVAGAATAMIAAVLALFVLGATSVAAREPWQDWRTWDLLETDGSRFAFDSMDAYGRLLDPDKDALVMRVRSPLASYWRANALGRFDGSSWSTGERAQDRLDGERAFDTSTYSVPSSGPVPPGTLVTQRFELEALTTEYFLTGGAARELTLGRDLPVYVTREQVLGVERRLGPKAEYTVTAVVAEVAPGDVIARGRAYPRDVLAQTDLPFPTLAELGPAAGEAEWLAAVDGVPAGREWLGLYELNRSIVEGATDPYEIALRIERRLRADYSYTLRPPATDYESPYAAFLFETRLGYCQQFAGAMAVLLRYNDVPARVAVGFTSGRRVADGTFMVSRTNAHAWVEVYFPQVGWVTFDPTPGRSVPGPGVSSTSAGFTDPFAATPGPAAAPAPAPESQEAQRPQEDRTAARDGQSSIAPAGPSGAVDWLVWLAVPAAALVAWPVARRLMRRRALRRGGADERLRASVALVYAELGDYGIDVPRSQTLDETARSLNERLDLDASALAERVQAVVYGGRRATEADVAALAAFRRALRRRLRERTGWRRAILALYGLPAAVPGKA
jgi:transglutaminase-like putative cysteine protease